MWQGEKAPGEEVLFGLSGKPLEEARALASMTGFGDDMARAMVDAVQLALHYYTRRAAGHQFWESTPDGKMMLLVPARETNQETVA